MSDKLEIEHKSNFWRHTGRSITVLGVSAFVVVPYLFALFRLTWMSFIVAIVVTVTLMVVKNFGYTPTVIFRTTLSKLGGTTVRRERRIGNKKIW